jgi:hypothetical protein
MMSSFYGGKSPARAWKPVTEGEIYVVLGLFMLTGIIQNPTLILCFTTKGPFSLQYLEML